MHSTGKTLLGVIALWLTPALQAQFTFEMAGRPVQIHSFVSQGFAYSNHNNYLTMKTSRGSFAMTDVGVNASIQLTDRFRIGAQVYDRDIGNLGKWHPQLDWAVADYRFTDWFGIRGGVVKTVFGLETDTQDVDALHTFALLPQSVYPTDLRDALLRHRGGDLYGEIPLKSFGSLSYTVYAGLRQDYGNGGYPYLLSGLGGHLTSYGGFQAGEDLRWNTPLKGLLVGASHVGADIEGEGIWDFVLPGSPPGTKPTRVVSREHSNRDWTNQFYGQYTAGNLRLASEYRRYWRDQVIQNGRFEISSDVRGWYASAAYRISKRLELGTYYSRWMVSWASTLPTVVQEPSQESPDRHLYDMVVTGRVDLTRHWNVKIEGHFMDGYGGLWSYPSGFYPQDNPQGLKPNTNLLLIRTGWSF